MFRNISCWVAGAATALVARDLYFVKTFSNQVEQAKQRLNTVYTEEIEETLIAKKNMAHGTHHDQLNETHELSFALKPGFEEELKKVGIKTPFFHTCLAYSVDNPDDKEEEMFYVEGRQSPAFQTQDAPSSSILSPEVQDLPSPPHLLRRGSLHHLRTSSDNERKYTTWEAGDTDDNKKIYRLLRTGVRFTHKEIDAVRASSNETICADIHPRSGLNTFFTSNCYSYSVYALTKFIKILLKKHNDPDSQRDNIFKLYKILLEVCSHSAICAHGIGNNTPVREAVFKIIQKVDPLIKQNQLEESMAKLLVARCGW